MLQVFKIFKVFEMIRLVKQSNKPRQLKLRKQLSQFNWLVWTDSINLNWVKWFKRSNKQLVSKLAVSQQRSFFDCLQIHSDFTCRLSFDFLSFLAPKTCSVCQHQNWAVLGLISRKAPFFFFWWLNFAVFSFMKCFRLFVAKFTLFMV